MQKKLKLKILSFLSLISLGACQAKIEYYPSDCLLIPVIVIREQDEKALLKYQEAFSYEFVKSLKDSKEIRKKICPKNTH